MRTYTGTPVHRQFWMFSRIATKVSVELSGSTPGSSRYPGIRSSRVPPRVYCPRTAWPAMSASSSSGWIARSSLTFSSRIASGWKEVGGSMRNNDSTCRTWFCTMSRIAPVVS